MEDLMGWFVQLGGSIHPHFSVETREFRGVFASKQVEEGEVLVHCPMSTTISARAFAESLHPSIVELVEKISCRVDIDAWSILASLFLVHQLDHHNRTQNVGQDVGQSVNANDFSEDLTTEMCRDISEGVDDEGRKLIARARLACCMSSLSSKTWLPYVRNLPGSHTEILEIDSTHSVGQKYIKEKVCVGPFESMVFADPQEISRLTNPLLALELLKAHYELQYLFRRIKEGLNEIDQNLWIQSMTFEEFCWGYAISLSRAFFLEDEVANQSDCFLLPVLDLVNHESMPNATVKCSFNENWVELRATRTIAAGEEVFISYGDRPIEEFLFIYGFIPRANRKHCFALSRFERLRLNSTQDDALFRLRSIVWDELDAVPLTYHISEHSQCPTFSPAILVDRTPQLGSRKRIHIEKDASLELKRHKWYCWKQWVCSGKPLLFLPRRDGDDAVPIQLHKGSYSWSQNTRRIESQDENYIDNSTDIQSIKSMSNATPQEQTRDFRDDLSVDLCLSRFQLSDLLPKLEMVLELCQNQLETVASCEDSTDFEGKHLGNSCMDLEEMHEFAARFANKLRCEYQKVGNLYEEPFFDCKKVLSDYNQVFIRRLDECIGNIRIASLLE